MTNYTTGKRRKLLSDKLLSVSKLKSVLQRCGNRERTHTYLTGLYANLKQAVAGYPTIGNYYLKAHDVKTPADLIDKCLFHLMPAFLLKRTVVAGKLYELPIPVSDNRAKFMASYWLSKGASKYNKNDLSFISLLTREIGATFYQQGSAREYLKAQIDIALDQLPFSRFIRKKRKVISKSKRTYVAKLYLKSYRKTLRFQRRADRHYGNVNKKINYHFFRAINARRVLRNRYTAKAKLEMKQKGSPSSSRPSYKKKVKTHYRK